MRRFMNVSTVAVCGLAVAAGLILSSGNTLEARPQYRAVANNEFPQLAKKEIKGVTKGGKFTCGLCHPVKSKKKRNDFGAAVGKNVGKKNQKDKKKIKEALEKAAKAKNKDGETYGSRIEAGKAPGGTEPVEPAK